MELKLVLWIAVCGVVLHAGADVVPFGEGFRPLLFRFLAVVDSMSDRESVAVLIVWRPAREA